MIRLGAKGSETLGEFDDSDAPPKRSAIVEPKRKQTSIFGAAPDITPEEHRRRGDAADALFRTIVRRATSERGRPDPAK